MGVSSAHSSNSKFVLRQVLGIESHLMPKLILRQLVVPQNVPKDTTATKWNSYSSYKKIQSKIQNSYKNIFTSLFTKTKSGYFTLFEIVFTECI
jgi:hypothetical protein